VRRAKRARQWLLLLLRLEQLHEKSALLLLQPMLLLPRILKPELLNLTNTAGKRGYLAAG
jgi:hypothetical protein